tara:strand:- start:47007 stop:47210 length:204 start_codon:yes stop_codon:yes gene_type:complete
MKKILMINGRESNKKIIDEAMWDADLAVLDAGDKYEVLKDRDGLIRTVYKTDAPDLLALMSDIISLD